MFYLLKFTSSRLYSGEVQIAQMEKQHEKGREDLQGLNIALDSEQQGLELVSLTYPPCFNLYLTRNPPSQMKCRMSVKGIAGTTPAQSNWKVSHIRRELSTFSPPNMHPTSLLSDASKDAPKVGKTSEPPSMTMCLTALGKSVRIN